MVLRERDGRNSQCCKEADRRDDRYALGHFNSPLIQDLPTGPVERPQPQVPVLRNLPRMPEAGKLKPGLSRAPPTILVPLESRKRVQGVKPGLRVR